MAIFFGLRMRQARPTYRVFQQDGNLAIECFECGAVSWNTEDVTNAYCAKCHRFHDD